MTVLLISFPCTLDTNKRKYLSPVQMPFPHHAIPHCNPSIFRKDKTAAMHKRKKHTPNPKRERASAPETGASVTIEASFAIPMFLFAVLCLIWMIEIQSLRINIIGAAQSAAKSASEQTALIPVLNGIKLRSDIVDLIGEERLENSIIKGGSSGISCWKSYVLPSTGEMNIVVEYEVKLPIPLFGNPSAEFREEIRMSAWTGYEDRNRNGEDSKIVYVTEHGTVYHEDPQCTYLQLSVSFIPYTEVERMRNESGGKYYGCEKCVFGTAMTGVYITDHGNRYHNSLNCSGLKRTIRAIEKSKAGWRGGCSKCTD